VLLAPFIYPAFGFGLALSLVRDDHQGVRIAAKLLGAIYAVVLLVLVVYVAFIAALLSLVPAMIGCIAMGVIIFAVPSQQRYRDPPSDRR